MISENVLMLECVFGARVRTCVHAYTCSRKKGV